ncbi:hypothetical protein [Corynebacterium sp.]|uniref:hypothetical protein n=1 Tax=Corynebacterium sp. TaxID=1720 RepID=UPI0026DBB217|nr:hypothetical protein [Corynebacterium sp.]MDO5076517.1 hypothetical protein [Corynebacterium sp.]
MHRRFVPAAVAIVGLSVGVSACAEEPQHTQRESDYKPIEIAVVDHSSEQLILGELYQRAFKREKRDAFLRLSASETDIRKIERVRNRNADLVIGCTGELLYELNPKLAESLSKEYEKDRADGKVDANNGEWRDKVYTAMVGSLPGKLTASDPSNATGCANYDGPELPQNIVPVFRKQVLNRDDRLVLNYISGTITTGDMRELAKKAEEENSVSAVVDPYLDQAGL